MPDEVTSVEIRPATAADAAAIAAVRRASWFAAYDGLIDHALIDRATVPAPAWTPPPYRRTIVAVTPADGRPAPVSAGAAADGARVVVGFASFGPERTVDSAIPPPQPVAAGSAEPVAAAPPPGNPGRPDGRPGDPRPAASPGDPGSGGPGSAGPGSAGSGSGGSGSAGSGSAGPGSGGPGSAGSGSGGSGSAGSGSADAWPGGSGPGDARPRGTRHGRRRARQPVPAGPLTAAGLAGETAEIYAIYLAPAAWSTGAGRALMDASLAALRAGGYQRVVLWVLTGNTRARRFYDKAGFAPDGATNILTGLGGVEELRYARPLAP
jgi:hypothetical protein